MTISRDDVVRIVKQPPNQKDMGLVGQVCLVDMIYPEDGFLYLSSITQDGFVSGGGAVPPDCVEPVTDEKWLKAAEIVKKASAQHELASMGDLFSKLGVGPVDKSNAFVQELLEKVANRPQQSAASLGITVTADDLAERFDLTSEEVMEIFYTIDAAIISKLKLPPPPSSIN